MTFEAVHHAHSPKELDIKNILPKYNWLILTKFCMNIMPLQATPLS